MAIELKLKDEMSYSNQIREHLMDYIYSDDAVEDAEHLECIFRLLQLMDAEIRDLHSDVAYYRKEIIRYKGELMKYEMNEKEES